MEDFINKKTKIISCEMIENEVDLIIKKLGIKLDAEITWIESKYHNNPEQLKVEIQKSINNIEEDVDNVLLLYGSCGNAIDGIVSDKYNLICMKVHDCISMLLGSMEKRKNDLGSYYFTKKYIESESSIWNDYCKCRNKYGDKKTQKMYKYMLKEYKCIKVINTGAYNVNDILDKSKEIARCCNLDHKIINANLNILTKALTKQWDNDFIIKKKNEKITFRDF